MKKYFTVGLFILLCVSDVQAQEEDYRSAFTIVSEPFSSESSVPAVYEYQIPKYVEGDSVVVFDVTNNVFVQSAVRTNEEKIYEKSEVSTSLTGIETGLNDDNASTSVDFKLPDSGLGTVDIVHTYKKGNTAKRYYIDLAPNVRRPQTVTIFATNENGKEEVVLAPVGLSVQNRLGPNGFIVSFPETTAKEWRVQLTYTQPLRIQNLGFVIENPDISTEQYVRFLHQPNHIYRMYGNPDRVVDVPTTYRTNLTDMKDVYSVEGLLLFNENILYVVSDRDTDGVPDKDDNCIDTANADQTDIDSNSVGDVCDDYDRDGIINTIDNCPNNPNTRQLDEDADGVGDMCDKEDNRLTEQYSWIPWVGLGFAVLVLIAMFTIVIRRSPIASEESEKEEG